MHTGQMCRIGSSTPRSATASNVVEMAKDCASGVVVVLWAPGRKHDWIMLRRNHDCTTNPHLSSLGAQNTIVNRRTTRRRLSDDSNDFRETFSAEASRSLLQVARASTYRTVSRDWTVRRLYELEGIENLESVAGLCGDHDGSRVALQWTSCHGSRMSRATAAR